MSGQSISYVIHEQGRTRIAELNATEVVVASPQDILDVIGVVLGHEADSLIMHERNVSPDFFDLSTGLAGEILQKYINYGLRFALVGDFDRFPSESLKAFIRESNRSGRIRFVSTVEEALKALANP